MSDLSNESEANVSRVRERSPLAAGIVNPMYQRFLAEHDECDECGNAACRGTELFPMRIDDEVEARCWNCLRLTETTKKAMNGAHHEVKVYFDGEPFAIASGPTPCPELFRHLTSEVITKLANKAATKIAEFDSKQNGSWYCSHEQKNIARIISETLASALSVMMLS